MRAYLRTTGALFGTVTGAHIWRMVKEPHLGTDVWYIALTVAAAALAVWAWRLLGTPVRS